MVATRKREEAMLYYLYIMSDGSITTDEEKLFNEICNGLDLEENVKNQVVKDCVDLYTNEDGVMDLIISRQLDEQLGMGIIGGKRDDASLARITWNLINIGYADNSFSDQEKEIVRYLVKKWGVRSDIYTEMIDSADTISALTKQKEWIRKALPKNKETINRLTKVNEDINRIYEDIKITINELAL